MTHCITRQKDGAEERGRTGEGLKFSKKMEEESHQEKVGSIATSHLAMDRTLVRTPPLFFNQVVLPRRELTEKRWEFERLKRNNLKELQRYIHRLEREVT